MLRIYLHDGGLHGLSRLRIRGRQTSLQGQQPGRVDLLRRLLASSGAFVKHLCTAPQQVHFRECRMLLRVCEFVLTLIRAGTRPGPTLLIQRLRVLDSNALLGTASCGKTTMHAYVVRQRVCCVCVFVRAFELVRAFRVMGAMRLRVRATCTAASTQTATKVRGHAI